MDYLDTYKHEAGRCTTLLVATNLQDRVKLAAASKIIIVRTLEMGADWCLEFFPFYLPALLETGPSEVGVDSRFTGISKPRPFRTWRLFREGSRRKAVMPPRAMNAANSG